MEPHETEATGASSGPQTLLCSYSLGGHVEACLLPPCPELQIQCGEVEPRKMPCNGFPMLLDCDPTQSPCSWQRPSTRGCFLPKNLAQKRGFETRRQALAFGSWGPGEGPVPCEDRAVSLCQEGQTHVGFAQRALYKGVTWKKDRKNSLGLEIKNKTKKENQKWDGLGQAEAKKTLWRKSSETFWRPEPKRGQKGEPLLRGQWKCPAGEQEGRPPSQERWSQQILRAGEKAYAHVLSLGDGSWGSPCLHQPVAQVEKSSKCQQCGKSFS
ncbi:zinc finger and SCAN domain-containing protein 32 isoform X2 [Canis lupus familiaris]|uniref:zinc finger and SCAN domain-containing protein 32 isoform X2 n=1 Tax=Canis lupus familiaris TaxID=9615 RepID=UPI0018F559F7|nr:zinc finger and SCAN domain-containing protein 32 isoform X2 [Canis lupus familiaris]XP_038396538.1 zinc finger and SCAN domain-containing protein 32 isoform X2 [Canis lupus familiaris]XP_038396539.1 zinc finger and SCAN domain-containing protein 32 isoform X2 [Canis lupus familiaris]XP_038396540.1 zinc finger and SCAN domain-containing protein 32 isoform X2 [Canis lupus familiaris]